MDEPIMPFDEFERRGWGDAGLATAYHEHLSDLTRQSVGPLLDAARVEAGTRVLDVATGPGYAAAAASARGAVATGLDLSAELIALARTLHAGVDFVEGDAMALPFEDGTVDAVVSNYGMPHFPDADAFLREALRVTMSGGRIAVATWASPSRAIGFGFIIEAIREHGSLEVPLPPGPDFFRFADEAECDRSLREAGWREPTFATLPQRWRLREPDALLDSMARGTVRTAALIRAQPREAMGAIRAAVREAVLAYVGDGALEVPMDAIVASAERP